MSFYTIEELEKLGFNKLGDNVSISKKASIYGHGRISIGNNTRIDDFVVLSAGEGGIEIGENVHIAIYSSLIGSGKIQLSNFSNISSRVSIYSSNDDYSGGAMTNPTIPPCYTNVSHQDVYIGKHVIIGCGCVVLPGVQVKDGVAVGALSLVNTDCKEWSIYVGNPIKKIKERKKDLLKLEVKYKE
ncbi:acyltransferase [Colwellia ponticola]|uniref:Acyltransferase n=1 Tax=Colwellia ponticola TaxID=2304625 RepID=A0A8H2JMR4_9GAMM|nr:acyltransferase [Colwellia ponticola]TMM46391.1 acyltransferase [Colwellia ponticola]